ncbi:hypothetical protein HYX14_00355 [Candidatus Woesearchaeota archaeon]|nr:hypothetical protein [Candidatus Woesearchaeota archaeon]
MAEDNAAFRQRILHILSKLDGSNNLDLTTTMRTEIFSLSLALQASKFPTKSSMVRSCSEAELAVNEMLRLVRTKGMPADEQLGQYKDRIRVRLQGILAVLPK